MSELDFKALHVLVVDDEPFMRQLVVQLLSVIGIKEISTAENGEKAIEAIGLARKPFDLIICDLQMPNMNGFEFIRSLRTSAQAHLNDTPIIVLSGHAQEENLLKSVSLGIHGFLVKPFSRRSLENRIKSAIAGPRIDSQILGLGS